MKAKILLVDDEEALLIQMREALSPDYCVLTGRDEEDALSLFDRERPPVVILDLSLRPSDPADLGGLRLLEQILLREPSTRVIIVTGDTQDTSALMALRLGAWDFYTKPVRMEELRVMIGRALHIHRLQQRLQRTESHRPGNLGIVSAAEPVDVNLKSAKRAMERDYIRRALTQNRGIVSRAARELGISRVNLYDLIQRYSIRLDDFKARRGRKAALNSRGAW